MYTLNQGPTQDMQVSKERTWKAAQLIYSRSECEEHLRVCAIAFPSSLYIDSLGISKALTTCKCTTNLFNFNA